MAAGLIITAAVEGDIDEAVAGVLVSEAGATLGEVYGRKGKPVLQERVTAYNHAAQRSPWLVLVDLDRDFECAPPLLLEWLPKRARFMALRIAVRAVESWFLAHDDGLASFLGISGRMIPRAPEVLDDPKGTIVNLARKSRRRDIREDVVPRDGSDRAVGPAYTARMIEFASRVWKPGIAARRSPSLRRGRAALRKLVEVAS